MMKYDAAQSVRREIGTGKGVSESGKDLLGDGRRKLVVCWILDVSAWTKGGRVEREMDVGWVSVLVRGKGSIFRPSPSSPAAASFSLRVLRMSDHLPSSECDAGGVIDVWAAREVWV